MAEKQNLNSDFSSANIFCLLSFSLPDAPIFFRSHKFSVS